MPSTSQLVSRLTGKLTAKVSRIVASRAAQTDLYRRCAQETGAALRDPANVTVRRCPVCDDDRFEATAEVKGAVYDFHRCQGCSLLYAPRVLRPEAERRHFSKRPVARDYWSFMYQDARNMQGQPVYAGLVARLAAAAPARRLAIDVGCHFGKLTAELGGAFDKVIGLELNPKTAKVGTDLHALGDRAEIRATRLEELPIDAGTVDAIVMNQILEHLTDPLPLFAAARRLLAPRGILYVAIPHGGSVGLRALGPAHRAVATHQHVNLFQEAPLRRLATCAGFTVEHIATDDQIDVSAADLLARRVTDPLLLAPGFAVDQVVRRVAALTRLPSRLGVGAQLEGLFRKDAD